MLDKELLMVKNDKIFFIEKNKKLITLNKVITTFINKYRNSYAFTVEEINHEIIALILEFGEKNKTDFNNLTNSDLDRIYKFLNRTLQYKFNKGLYSFVISIKQKNRRIYIKNLRDIDNESDISRDSDSQDVVDIFESLSHDDYRYYTSLDIHNEVKKLNGKCFMVYKETVNSDNPLQLKKNHTLLKRNVLNNKKTYNQRYLHMLRQKELIERYLDNENFDEELLKELLNKLDDIVYQTVNLDENNPIKLTNELYRYCDIVSNYKNKYIKDLKKDYNIRNHIRDIILNQDPTAKVFIVNSYGIIVDWE